MENETREVKFRAWDIGQEQIIEMKDFNPDYFYDMICNSVRHEIKLMQFTGLKDKNNKEIYDQFIILYGEKLYLVYQCQTGEWKARNKGENLSLFDISNESELRGNIYENPEMLEEQQ